VIEAGRDKLGELLVAVTVYVRVAAVVMIEGTTCKTPSVKLTPVGVATVVPLAFLTTSAYEKVTPTVPVPVGTKDIVSAGFV
jgi:hypothetical protein